MATITLGLSVYLNFWYFDMIRSFEALLVLNLKNFVSDFLLCSKVKMFENDSKISKLQLQIR
jgi:hypothetical protein